MCLFFILLFFYNLLKTFGAKRSELRIYLYICIVLVVVAAKYLCFPNSNSQRNTHIAFTKCYCPNRQKNKTQRNEMKWNKLLFHLHVGYGWCHFALIIWHGMNVCPVSIFGSAENDETIQKRLFLLFYLQSTAKKSICIPESLIR